MVEILDIEPGSIAEELGIRPGAKLISINGKTLSDNLDYRFYNAGEDLEVLVEQAGEQVLYEIEKEYQEDLGFVLEDLKMRKCGNRCVFCFVHQNPKGLRKTLYFKDEDYRFSFLYGHYVTLTNATQHDLDRIVEQRLTPLYVSVHVTDHDLRRYMLGIKYDDGLLEKIEYLTRNGIELDCQIVLCPGLNDGEHLDKTILDLKAFYPGVQSVAIVPVGLTRHRRNLPVLNPVTNEYSLALMEEIAEKRSRLRQELGSSFVYLSDEFYIRTGVPIPDNDYYEGFYQLENGVGLTRDMMNRFQDEFPQILNAAPQAHLSLVSGVLGTQALRRYFFPELEKIPGLKISMHSVINHFYGESIVVAGLLVGQDIYDALKDQPLGDYVILPPRVLNHDGIFLDDWTVENLENKIQRKVFIFPDSFVKLFENIAMQNSRLSAEVKQKIRHGFATPYVAEKMKGGRR